MSGTKKSNRNINSLEDVIEGLRASLDIWRHWGDTPAEFLVEITHYLAVEINNRALQEDETGRLLRQIAAKRWRWPVIASISSRDKWGVVRADKQAGTPLQQHLSAIDLATSTGRTVGVANYKVEQATIAEIFWRKIELLRRSPHPPRWPDAVRLWEKARALPMLEKKKSVIAKWRPALICFLELYFGAEWIEFPKLRVLREAAEKRVQDYPKPGSRPVLSSAGDRSHSVEDGPVKATPGRVKNKMIELLLQGLESIAKSKVAPRSKSP